MAYREDSDLEFFKDLNSEDLNDLVHCLTHDKDGDPRLTEELTDSSGYKLHYPKHVKYWDDIAAEIQCFGANTFVTMLRGGQGVQYKEVLTDVCDKLKVNYNKESSVEIIEKNLLMKILTDALEKMSAEELKELAKSVGIKNKSNITPQVLAGIFQAMFRAGGFKSYQLTVIIANAILKILLGRGLTLGGNILLTKTMAILTGPIGWVMNGIWTAIDIAGPAYRVTIPAVIQVAVLRQKTLYENTVEEVAFT